MKIKKLIIILILSLLSVIAFSERKNSAGIRTGNFPKTGNISEIKKLDILIDKFEKGFLAFIKRLNGLFKKHAHKFNPKTIKAIKEPLTLFLNNYKNNKFKNAIRYKIMMKRKGHKPPYHYFKNNAFYRYNILPKIYRKRVSSGFNMRTRVLFLNPSYDPDSLFDNIVAFHEIVHALQDTTLRNFLAKKGKKSKRLFKIYIRSLHPRTLKDPDLEPVAYAIEIELLNFLFGDGIRQAVINRRIISSRQIAGLLKANTMYKFGSLRVLLKYAIIYFYHNCWIYSYTRYYRSTILRDYMRLGYRFYRSDNKFIKPAPRLTRRYGRRYRPRNYRNRFQKRPRNRIPFRRNYRAPNRYNNRINRNRNNSKPGNGINNRAGNIDIN